MNMPEFLSPDLKRNRCRYEAEQWAYGRIFHHATDQYRFLDLVLACRSLACLPGHWSLLPIK